MFFLEKNDVSFFREFFFFFFLNHQFITRGAEAGRLLSENVMHIKFEIIFTQISINKFF